MAGAVLALWPLVYHNDYVLLVMVVAGIYSLMAIGFTILAGQARQLSLGHGAFFGIGAYTSVLLTTRLGAPPPLALLGGALAAGVVAFLMGKPVLRLRGFVLALVTLGMGQIFFVFAREARDLTGGLIGLTGIPYFSIGGFSLDNFLRQYYAVWSIVLVGLILGERAIRSRPGRALRALAVNDTTAATVGIDSSHWKLVAFVVSAVYAGAAGSLFAFIMGVINPDDFGFMLSTLVIVMTMLGGMGSLSGAVAGSILMSWLARSFSSYQDYSGSLYAVTLILLVLFLPGGLAGGLRQDQVDRLRSLFRFGQLVPESWRSGPAIRKQQIAGHPDLNPSERERTSTGLTDRGTQVSGTRMQVFRGDERHQPPRIGDALLKLENVSVSFGGLQAVNHVSLVVREGAIAALIGPNGAGKTTLFNTISGLQPIQAGRIWFAGREVTRTTPLKIARLGIARTFQNVHVFGNMTVLDNVMVGRHRHERASYVDAAIGLRWQAREEEISREKSREALALVGLEDCASVPVSSLSYGQQRLVEIARALATEPKLVLLDEPAAGLNASERAELMKRVPFLRDQGITVLLVEHDMELVMGISDTVSVLNYGHLIAQGTPTEIQRNTEVIQAYLGVKRDAGQPSPPDATHRVSVERSPNAASGKENASLELDSISTYYGSIGAVRDVSMSVPAGEIVTVLGANGAGKTTLLRTVSGLLRPRDGRIRFGDREISRLTAPEITAAGVGHVLEGRHVFPTLSVQDNLRLGAYRRRDSAEIAANCDFVYDLFPVLQQRRNQMAGTLSGGEQQMLAIGRAVMGQPRLLLLDEPSMGLAPLVVECIFETLVELNRRGMTLLMVEQNAEMALSIAHRGVVLQTGRVLLSGTAQELRSDDRVRDLYLGGKS